MRIQHNIMAMNAYRNYTGNTSALSKNLEKLSSGYKINRAGDDAAGLAISEKMRAQVTGLKAAQKNAKDGISLVQTAEGALTEVHSMLNRMVDLADQSANGTYDNGTDRANLQKEIEALKDEINRISDSTNFNGIKLLNGDQAAKVGAAIDLTIPAAGTTAGTDSVLQTKAVAASATEFSVDLDGLGLTGLVSATTTTTLTLTVGTKTISVTGAKNGMTAAELAALFASKTFTVANGTGSLTYKAAVNGSKLVFTTTGTPVASSAVLDPNGAVQISAAAGSTTGTINTGIQVIKAGAVAKDGKQASTVLTLNKDMLTDGAQIKIGDTTYTFAVGADSKNKTGSNVVDLTGLNSNDADYLEKAVAKLTDAAAGNADFTVGQNGTAGKVTIQQKSTSTKDLTTEKALKAQFSMTTPPADKGGLTLQIGDTSDGFNQLTVSVGNMNCASLGIDTINIGTQAGGKTAIDQIKKAINSVSSTRGDLGATQNRLEHTINNLSVMTENIQDAEANIRDVDVAEEMMAYTKNNILVQSAQAMLAQANQLPQGVLQLLQ